MSCDTCDKPAEFFCECVGARMCEDCLDVHCATMVEHKLIPMSERQESYSRLELRQNPDLIKAKIASELLRLTEFRSSILAILDQTTEELISQSEDTVREWVSRWLLLLEEQKQGLEAAVSIVRTAKLDEKLPTEGYPWSLIGNGVQNSFVRLPEEMSKVKVRFEDAIGVGIRWDWQDGELKEEKIALQETTEEETEVELLTQEEKSQEIDLARITDPQLLFSRLKLDSDAFFAYFHRKFLTDKSWKLREIFPDSDHFRELERISVQNLPTSDEFIWKELALVLGASPQLRALRISSSFVKKEDFELICQCIATLPLETLELEKCKIGDSQLSRLNSALPPSLRELNLSYNYFHPSLLDLQRLQSLSTLNLEGLAASGEWREEVLSLLPSLRLLS